MGISRQDQAEQFVETLQPDVAEAIIEAASTGADNEVEAAAPAAAAATADASQEEMEEPHVKGKVVNFVLIGIAFGVLVGCLVFAGEGSDLVEALSNMEWPWLFASIVLIFAYWLLEAGNMQVFALEMWPGFRFSKTWMVTMIGQYFNCITPLSSGGQPFQAYYYSRFGMPLSKSMPMLLCRFITYQIATTTFCALMLLLRFNYFSEQYPYLMVLVGIGFAGGMVLLLGLLALAFMHKTTLKVVGWFLKLGNKLHLIRDYSAMVAKTTATLDDAYKEVSYLVHKPKLLFKCIGLTFVQLTEYFAISYTVACGLGVEGADPLTTIACQSFVYMISSFVPTPGAMGAAEGSYAVFMSAIYPNASTVALSVFVWRLLTFYLPIVVGACITLWVNRGKKANHAME